MNSIQKLFTICILLLFSFSTYSQIPSVGGMIYYPSEGNRAGFGGIFDFPRNDKTVYTASLRLHFGSSSSEVRANAIDSQTEPSYINIPIETSYSFILIKAGIKRYFRGDYIGSPGFYWSAKGGITLNPISKFIDNYDMVNYAPRNPLPTAKETRFAPSLGLGIGGEWDIKFGYFFLEAEFDFLFYSLNTFNKNGGLSTVNLGIRVPVDIGY